MPGLPPKSDSAKLLALSEYVGEKLPVALRNEIKSHEAALGNVPAAVNARARAQRDFEAAKKSVAVDDVTATLKHFKSGDFETLDLGPDALAVATVALAEAERYDRAVKRAAQAAALNVGDIARRTKLADRLARYWRDIVLVDLDRAAWRLASCDSSGLIPLDMCRYVRQWGTNASVRVLQMGNTGIVEGRFR